jgi:hypothetical protein
MTDDRILETVRAGLDGAHMHRPVSAIFRRARIRRSSSAVAFGGLAVGVSLAVAIPFVHSGSAAVPPPASSSVALQPVSFTLVQSSDGRYTFDVVPGVPLDLPAVERALADIGITAVVRTNERCVGTPQAWPDSRGFRLNSRSDGSVSITLDAATFPDDATLSLTLGLDRHGVLRMVGLTVYHTGTQTGCTPVNLFKAGSR